MRHQPARVGRIARVAAAEMVVDPAQAHLVERQQDGIARRRVAVPEPGPPEQLERRRVGELGRGAEPALHSVELFGEPVRGLVVDLDRDMRAGLGPRHLRDALPERLRRLARLLRRLAPHPGEPLQHVGEARPAPAPGRREVGAAPERLAVGRQEHGQRPAALLAHHVQRPHVDGVDVGAFLAIDLDVDEIAVHQGGDRVVLEALMRHHVAPVAGGVADGQEDRLVLRLRAVQRRRPPGVPVDGVVGMLQQIGAGLFGEAVHRSVPWGKGTASVPPPSAPAQGGAAAILRRP